jgi:hypothetical protein
LIKVVAHRTGRRKIARQGAPCRRVLQQVQDRAKNIVQVLPPWASFLPRPFQQGLYLVELLPADITWVMLSFHPVSVSIHMCLTEKYRSGSQKSIHLKKDDARANGEVETAATACIALTVPEIRKLLCRLVWRYLPDVTTVIHWSLWRRHHQAVAHFYHCLRRAVPI